MPKAGSASIPQPAEGYVRLGLPARGAALPDHASSSRLAQGGHRAIARPGLAPRRADPRQGHRGRLRANRRAGGGPIHRLRRARQGRIDPAGAPSQDTAADGSFQFGALPSPGYLSVMAPDDDYVLQAIGSRMVEEGQPGGQRYYSHANILADLKPGIRRQGGPRESPPRHHREWPGDRAGRPAGPRGLDVQPDHPQAESQRLEALARDAYHDVACNGRFEVHGLDPDAETPVYFLEPRRKLGATVVLSGKSAAGGPVTVRLEPCGPAKARLVNADGKPIAGRYNSRLITMVVTPGVPDTLANEKAGLLAADESLLDWWIRSTTRCRWCPTPMAASLFPS